MTSLLCLLLLAPRTVPDPPLDANALFVREKVEALYREGLALYQEGRYREALPKFEAAQALFADPTLVYNIGRCHEELGEIRTAEARYDALVADAAAPADLRAKAAARRAALPLVAPPPPPVTPPAVVPPPPTDPYPWLLMGTGAAALAAGSVFVTLGLADHAELEEFRGLQAPELSAKKARELDESGTQKKAAGGALLGLGATAVGVGIYLLVGESDDATISATVLPLGLGLVARF